MNLLLGFLLGWTIVVFLWALGSHIWLTHIRPPSHDDEKFVLDDWLGLWTIFAVLGCMLLYRPE